MKTLKYLAAFLIPAILMPHLASASLVGPYTPDANTLVLLHLDEASGGSVTTNAGSLTGNFITVNFSSTGNPLPAVTTMLGYKGYSSGPTNFNNCESNTTSGYMLGYDFNRDGSFEGDTGSANPANSDYLPMSDLNIGNGGQTPFTLEAVICPTTIANNNNADIISTDSHNSQRCFFLRIVNSSGQLSLAFQYVGNGSTPPSQALSANIPTLAQDPENGFVAGTWYHVAFTYDGTNGTLYWTKLDPSLGAAHVLGTSAMSMGAAYGSGTGPLCVGNRARSTGTETFPGAIDEVRISSVCRAANQMQFYSPAVTITQNPVSQNVDYNQPVSFTVQASSLFALGYQWLFNSNGIAGATNATYTIPNVAAANAGYYYCVVTNVIGYSATSSVARLVVGAANFLNHRYSFLSSYTNLVTGMICTPDLIAGADGTNFGDAFETNDQLVLDGTPGTFLQLPQGIVNGSQETALTVEFWATIGANGNNAYAFTFGATNAGIGGHALLCYTPHNAVGEEMFISSADFAFAETNAAPGVLDGEAVHVACVFDAPDGTMAIYTNGVLAASGPDTVGLGNINDVYSFIGASLNPGDPYLVANINELRIFNGALSGITIMQSQILGPTNVPSTGPANFIIQPASISVPLGQTATFTAGADGYLPITYQWFKNGTLLPGATNNSYSFVPVLTDNSDSFVCHATNTIGVTTYVTNTTTATLSVFLPPTLSWLGAADGGADDSWNTTSLDWTNDTLGGGIIAFAQTNGAYFDDRSGGGQVDLEQAIIPYYITVNAASSYMFTSSGGLGSLAGQGSLTKENSGTLDIDLTNNLTGPITISGGELQIGNNDTFGTLGSGPVTNNATLSIYRGDTILNVANPIHGSGTLSFDGSGAATLSGNNDYTGSTLINNGIVYLTSSTGLGSISTGTLVGSGGQLYATANVDCSEPFTLNGAGDGNGALRKGGAGTTTEWGTISLGSASTIGVDSGATLVLSNTVSGAVALTVTGGGTLALDVNNTFNGGLTLNGPVINVGTSGALGSGPVTVSGAGHFLLANGLNLANFLDATTVNPGSGLGILMVNDNTNGIVTTISGPLEFDGTPSSGGDFVGPTTSGYLNVTGPITNTVTGDISSRLGFIRYSGGGNYTLFTLNGGTASLGANNGLCTNASMTVGSSGAAIFDLNGFSQALTGLTDGGANSELVTNSEASVGTLTLDLSGPDTYSGVIAGNVALVENGQGNNLYLAGTNTYTGTTTINSGSLELAQPGLAANSSVIVANGAMLQLDFAVTNQVSALVTNGISAGAGVYSTANASPYLEGQGYLLVSPGPSGPGYITNSISGNTLTLTWPAGQDWRLVSQTNSLSTGLNPNPSAWSTVAGASDGRATITVSPSGPTVFYRLVYP